MTLPAELAGAAEGFGIGPLVEPPARVGQAFSNEVWQVRTGVGVFAVKLFPAQLTDARRRHLLSGIAFEQLVLGQGSIRVPRPVAAPEGWLVELPTATGTRLARCHEWVRGDPAHRPLRDELVATAGSYLGVLHALQRPGGDTSQLAPLDLQRWHRDVGLAREIGIGWADRLAELTPLVEELAVDLDALRAQRRPMHVSHRDYDPKNAIIGVDGQLVIADWDYAGPVLLDVELIVGVTSFAQTDGQVVIFVEAYRAAGGDAIRSDSLAMSAELADLDWLLRNVESCLGGDHDDAYATAESLTATLPDEVAAARDWPERLRRLVG